MKNTQKGIKYLSIGLAVLLIGLIIGGVITGIGLISNILGYGDFSKGMTGHIVKSEIKSLGIARKKWNRLQEY